MQKLRPITADKNILKEQAAFLKSLPSNKQQPVPKLPVRREVIRVFKRQSTQESQSEANSRLLKPTESEHIRIANFEFSTCKRVNNESPVPYHKEKDVQTLQNFNIKGILKRD